jgi:hypothetical protein
MINLNLQLGMKQFIEVTIHPKASLSSYCSLCSKKNLTAHLIFLENTYCSLIKLIYHILVCIIFNIPSMPLIYETNPMFIEDEAAALALTATILNKLNLDEIAYINSEDHSDPPDWRMLPCI